MPENANAVITEGELYNKIYLIRGQKVMLDFDLAEIYGYVTKSLNRQVKNNLEKFEGEDFVFRLTKEEVARILRCKNCTSSLDKKLRPDLKLKFIKTNHTVHDRFIVIDNQTIYQAGSSSKDAGSKISTIHEITDSFIIKSILNEVAKLSNNPELVLA